jgi:hypothetical protein
MNCLRTTFLRFLTSPHPYQALPFPPPLAFHTEFQPSCPHCTAFSAHYSPSTSPNIALNLYLFSLYYWGLVFFVLAILSIGPIAVNCAGSTCGIGETDGELRLGGVMSLPKQISSLKDLEKIKERLYFTRLALVVFDGVQVVLILLAFVGYTYFSMLIVRKYMKKYPSESHFSLRISNIDEEKYRKLGVFMELKGYAIAKLDPVATTYLNGSNTLQIDQSDLISSNNQAKDHSFQSIYTPNTPISLTVTFVSKENRANCYRELTNKQGKRRFPGLIVQSAVEKEEILNNNMENLLIWPSFVFGIAVLGAFVLEITLIWCILASNIGKIVLIGAVSVSLIWFIELLALKTAIWSHPFSLSTLKSCVFTRISLFSLANISITVLIYTSFWDLNRESYSELSLFLCILLLFLLIPYIQQAIWVRIKPYLLTLLVRKRQIVEKWSYSPDIDLPGKYFIIILAIYVGFGPAGGMPLLNSACSILFLSLFLLEKANNGLYAPPIENSLLLHRQFYAFLAGAAPVHSLISWWLFTNDAVFPASLSYSYSQSGDILLSPTPRNWQEKAADYPQILLLVLTVIAGLVGGIAYKRLKIAYEFAVSKPLEYPASSITPSPSYSFPTLRSGCEETVVLSASVLTPDHSPAPSALSMRFPAVI